MKRIVLYASITLMAGLALTNIYNSLVDAPNWGGNLPQSIENARAYFSVSNPGDFYRIFSPANQVLAILSLVLFWRSGKRVRLFLGFAVLVALAGDALTFGYFYPRNAILFRADVRNNLAEIAEASRQWSSMNWVRSLLVGLGLVFQFLALDQLVAPKAPA
ncbi:MAG: DUF1772 domain-containing protein [Saprospiraceae bacterium]